jgi:transcriptional regulator with XRE-family HTH domain
MRESDRILGKNFKLQRSFAGYTQQETACALGVHQSVIARIEGGQQKLTYEFAHKAAKFFKTSIKSFCKGLE